MVNVVVSVNTCHVSRFVKTCGSDGLTWAFLSVSVHQSLLQPADLLLSTPQLSLLLVAPQMQMGALVRGDGN